MKSFIIKYFVPPDDLPVHACGQGAGLEPGEAAAAVRQPELHHRLDVRHPTLGRVVSNYIKDTITHDYLSEVPDSDGIVRPVFLVAAGEDGGVARASVPGHGAAGAGGPGGELAALPNRAWSALHELMQRWMLRDQWPDA